MIQAYINLPHWQCWPFWALELTPDASMSDIEKSVRDLNAKIQFGFEGAEKFKTPLGLFDRDEYLLRDAKAKLQNPEDRLKAEFWYIAPETVIANQEKGADDNVIITESSWLKLFRVR